MIDEFKKGDYIVVLQDHVTIDNWANYIFKQDRDSKQIDPEILIEGTKNNGSKGYSGFKHTEDWRYATPEEIEEYKIQGKPFKVTEFMPKKVTQDYSYLESFFNKLNIK